MSKIIDFIKKKWVIHLAGVLALCLLIWFIGPRLSFRKMTPLESEFNRLLAILVVVVAWSLINLIQQAHANKKEQQLLSDLAAPPTDPGQNAIEQAQTKESEELHRKFEQALQLLKQTRAKGSRDKQFVYELPWYIIIGAPGCGKTTLLENSGLNFPLSGKIERNDVTGVGGTRNCDWLFANEAIFLDTAGRYTTQDSHQPVDAAAWRGFLGLIKKHRPRRPINGVLVAMSVSDLLQQTEHEIRQHAETIRARIAELFDVLGHRFPIYVLFTKCDLMAGFTDFFASLAPQERAQVWGETFAEDDSQQPQTFIDQFLSNYGDLIHRLDQYTLSRIQDERDIQRRSLILNFPQQMALLKSRLQHFLHLTFTMSPYEKDVPMLRGLYFTSGTQEGTPIDRIMGALASTYGLNRQETPNYSGRGKSYFITRLLKEVIFPEAQLAGANKRIERRLRLVQMAAYAGVILVTVIFLSLWSISYVRNANAIAEVERQVETFKQTTGNTTSWDAAVQSLANRLDILKTARDRYEHSSIWMGFGLSQGDKLQAGIDWVYGQLLNKQFLPIITTRLEQRIQDHLNGRTDEELAVLYELLKVYLMLEQPRQRLDQDQDQDLAIRRINADWYQVFPRKTELCDQLEEHTARLFRSPLAPMQTNSALVAQARKVLNRQPLAAQLFAQMQVEASADHLYDVDLQKILPPQSDMALTTNDGQPLWSIKIPGLFTYEGYHKFFSLKGEGYVSDALKRNWVLNNYAADQEKDLPRLYDDLEKIYFTHYEKQWRELLNNVKVKKAQGMVEENQLLDILASPETPLRPLLETVEQNTTLSRPLEAQKDEKAKPSQVDRILAANTLPPAARKMENSFADIHYLVRSSDDAPAPLDNLIAGLSKVRDFMMQIDSAADSDEVALNKALERIHGGGGSEQIKAAQMDFARQPEPFKSWFSSLTSSSMEITLASAKSELNAIWKAEVLPFYKAGIQGRYPVAKTSPYDITIDDFSRFFMPNGIIDRFFQNHLKPFVDTSSTQWGPRNIDGQIMPLSNEAIRQLQNAAKIRDTFFAAGSTPSVDFELKVIELSGGINNFRIDIEGQNAEYSYGPVHPVRFTWPGPRANTGVRLTFSTDNGEIYDEEEGPWAWMKMLDKSIMGGANQSDRFILAFKAGRYTANYELRAASVLHPFQLKELYSFRCPESF